MDRPAARFVAALVVLLCVCLLAYVHRDDLRTLAGANERAGAATSPDDPAAPCIEARFAEIDGMIGEGVIDEGQAALFRQRAEAMCRATEGDGGGAPPTLPAE